MAQVLLAEPAIRRKTREAGRPLAVTFADRIGQWTVRVPAAPAALTTITSQEAARLARLSARPQTCDRHIPEAGQGRATARTLRLDIARVALSAPAITMISFLRHAADPQEPDLMQILPGQSKATVVLALPSRHSSSNRSSKAL
jgi:hypothetical protein